MNCRTNLANNGAVNITYQSSESDKMLFSVMQELTDYFNDRYIQNIPYLNIKHVKKLNYFECYNKLKKNGFPDEYINPLVSENIGKYNIQPDGGAIILQCIDDKNKIFDWKLLLASEMKYQGTNEERIAEGKKKQAIGNAIERVGKNANFIKLITLKEKIYPYVCFCEGCDFEEDFVKAKLIALANGGKPNNVNILKFEEMNLERLTFFTKKEYFTENEIRDKLKPILQQSLTYYINTI